MVTKAKVVLRSAAGLRCAGLKAWRGAGIDRTRREQLFNRNLWMAEI